MQALGDFIGGRFHGPEGDPLRSESPCDGRTVFETAADPRRITLACEAASEAAPAWAAMSFDARAAALQRFRDALSKRADAIAEAIRLETGKIDGEARGELAALIGRFDAAAGSIRRDMKEGPIDGASNELVRHHPHGVVGVIGPFNFPLHLCHAHVVPALLLGNTVVVKPSEVTPLSAQRYAEAALDAALPSGVLNVVQGSGAAGAALTSDRRLRALAFTGSWPTGRRILESLLDRPDVLVALEMGGKNIAVVCEDADVRQAAHEIVTGAYLTTGQRCTCTDRVLVHHTVRPALLEALRRLVGSLRFGDPTEKSSFAGPMTTAAGRAKYLAAIERARAAGAEEVARGGAPDGGRFVAPTLHVLPDGVHAVAGYTDEELFGPDLAIESFRSDDEAIACLDASSYGLAHSVFTSSDARFERYFRETRTGILNKNRSTNQASPRLPFGGVGKSGNFRPAGSWACRNMAFPVAVQERLPGEIQLHGALAPYLVAPDLDRLEAQQSREEDREAARDLLTEPRPMAIRRPKGGRLPASEKWLERLYAGDRVVREKKPGVFDHLRSAGAWFVSVDDEPLSVIDAMSQTATVAEGFGEDPVVRAYVEGGFGETLAFAHDTSLGDVDVAERFAERLRELAPGLPHVSFVNSGAEACEKALALCRLQAKRDEQRKVLAFEGSFHGRTLLSLHASYNPSKRAPFEIAGYEVSFAPFPVWWRPHDEEPDAPAGYLDCIADGDLSRLEDFIHGDDAMLAAEVHTIEEVTEKLATGEYFAVAVEPMQSEGGDRYATGRFFQALRLLTRRFGVPLIFDEVQTGFGLGGTFLWHHRFDLYDLDGQPDGPDCVTFAKRAQTGIVMSRFEDPEPTSAHPASLVRGLVRAEMMSVDPQAVEVQSAVRQRLAAIAERFPELVESPRATGYALAFDLPTPQHLNAYLAQRFWRGAIVFGAGSRTVRYRLSRAFGKLELDLLFEAIRRSLSWLDANPGLEPPAWLDLPGDGKKLAPSRDARQGSAAGGTRFPVPGAARGAVAEHTFRVPVEGPRPALPERPEVRVRETRSGEATQMMERILDLEARVYEPARREPFERLRLAFDDPDGVAVVAEVRVVGSCDAAGPDPRDLRGDGWMLAGFVVGAPLERLPELPGPDRDPMRGRDNTLYSISVTVDPEYRGLGIGRLLKKAQIEAARAKKRADGTPRYRHITGRNRVGRTQAMMYINRSFGAYEVFRLHGQYGDPNAQASYYRQPIGPFVIDSIEVPRTTVPPGRIDFAQGVSRPLCEVPEPMQRAIDRGLFYGPAVNKITLCNYVTPAVVRATEWIGALAPRTPHVYLTSSRDETFDKTVRALRYHRKHGQVVLGLEGGYVGHTTAAARSLSDPSVHRQGPGYFDAWKRAPHPSLAGEEATIEALRAQIAAAGGAEKILGIFVEPLQERTGRTIPGSFWQRLGLLREQTGVPVVLVETATASYRSARGAFWESAIDFVPDALVWWGGGQIGFVHVTTAFFVAAPLTMVSTWDGDELSLVRVHHQLRAARRLDVAGTARALDAALAPAKAAGFDVRGGGLYRVVDAGGRASAVEGGLAARGVRVRRFPNGCIAIAPPLDVSAEHLERFARAFAEVCR